MPKTKLTDKEITAASTKLPEWKVVDGKHQPLSTQVVLLMLLPL
jgi:hypothetical protein